MAKGFGTNEKIPQEWRSPRLSTIGKFKEAEYVDPELQEYISPHLDSLRESVESYKKKEGKGYGAYDITMHPRHFSMLQHECGKMRPAVRWWPRVDNVKGYYHDFGEYVLRIRISTRDPRTPAEKFTGEAEQ